MPSLKSADLTVGPAPPHHDTSERWDFVIMYSAPSKEHKSRRLRFYLFDTNWRPEEETLQTLRGVGKERWGDTIEELFIKSEYVM